MAPACAETITKLHPLSAMRPCFVIRSQLAAGHVIVIADLKMLRLPNYMHWYALIKGHHLLPRYFFKSCCTLFGASIRSIFSRRALVLPPDDFEVIFISY